jgi:hypothetical protein
VGSHLKGRFCVLEIVRRIFARMFVFCNATQVHVLLVRHLPHHICAHVGRKQLRHGALIGSLFLLVVSAVTSSLSASVTGVSEPATWVLVILVRFYSMLLVSARRLWRLFFVETWL